MKKILLFLVFTFIYCDSFSQIFHNDLNYLIFDSQDSLLKKRRVKSLQFVKQKGLSKKSQRITDRRFEDYYSNGLIKNRLVEKSKKYISKEKTTYGFVTSSIYRYDSLNRLQEKKIKEKKTILKFFEKQKAFKSYKRTDFKYKYNYKKRYAKVSHIYDYDSLDRREVIKSCFDSKCEYKKIYHFGDTTKIFIVEKKGKELIIRETIENEFLKKDFYFLRKPYFLKNKKIKKRDKDSLLKKMKSKKNYLLNREGVYVSEIREMFFNKDSLIARKKLWKLREGPSQETIFFNSDKKVTKKIKILRVKYPLTGEEIAYRDVALYSYDDKNRLIKKIELNKNIKTTKSFEYYDNDLLKTIYTESGTLHPQTEIFTYTYY